MKPVYIIGDNIISPLGSTTSENFLALKEEKSGIKKHDDHSLAADPFYASLFTSASQPATTGSELLSAGAELFPIDDSQKRYPLFERILIHSIQDALIKSAVDPANERTVFIISSTKGNISMLERNEQEGLTGEHMSLYNSAKLVAAYFKNSNQPLVVSNACISGVLGILTAKRLLEAGMYETAIVAGADLITRFILSGFQSFQAVSPEPCRPFDVSRQGVTLGEGAATMIISVNKPADDNPIRVMGGAISNDANHISGPSRTGEPLHAAIERTFKESGLTGIDIGFISAHGTATIYNDEMEAKAISLSGMEEVPVNSLKGYYGHTLGAAGLIESVITVESLKANIVIPTKGFHEKGVSKEINICSTLETHEMKYALKTASGFGGCNAAMVFGKES
ncbi:MAG TPA: beta-ketoacyl synthase N-terminal-like domain-containing protein [Flavitalea sp.]|nr:beta-ketoacyl synthase N-terminal-like domain-containing protein [Flavitalea sp.]